MKYITEEGRKYFNEARELQLERKISLAGLVPGIADKFQKLLQKQKSRKVWPGLEKKKRDKTGEPKTGWWDAPVLDKAGKPRTRTSLDPRKGSPDRVPLTRKGQAIGKGLEIASDLVTSHEEPIKQGLKGISPESTPYEPATDQRDDDDDEKKLTSKELQSLRQAMGPEKQPQLPGMEGEGTPAKSKKKRQTGPRRKGKGKGDHPGQQYLPGLDPEKEDDKDS